MIVFNPTIIATPIAAAISAFQAEAQSPAAYGRVQFNNFSVGTAAGFANPAAGLTAQDGQRFEIGSQTKMMTATVILQLVSEGKIDLNDLASKYLPAETIKGIANADLVTVKQLLQMTSGIANFTDVLTPDGRPQFVANILSNPDKAFTPNDALDIVRGLPAAGPIGSYFYSNTNYNLLGNIIEAVTKEPLAKTFETRIFTPADMKSSDLYGAQAPADLVHGFGTGPDGKLIDSTAAKWSKFAEGGVVSTTEDMIKFIKALLVEGKLLPPKQLDEMKSFLLAAESPELKFSFGLGLVEFDLPGAGKFLGFNGGTLGFLSSTYISAETGAVATAAINYADAAAATETAVLKLLELVKEDPSWKAINSFDARSDVLDIQSVSAASTVLEDNGRFSARFGDVTLKLPLDVAAITTSNVKFEDGSVLVVGDNKVATGRDERANSIDILRDFAQASSKDNQILGLGGDDRLSGGNGNDRILGGNGNDYINGRNGNDTLLGGKGSDFIEGKNGNDILNGGEGRDFLFGGNGADSFEFSNILDSTVGRNTRDVIYDFGHGVDKISLAGIDANALLDLDQQFIFIGKGAFSGHAGELRYFNETQHCSDYGKTIVEGDVNGDGRADFQIELTGSYKLDAIDFIL